MVHWMLHFFCSCSVSFEMLLVHFLDRSRTPPCPHCLYVSPKSQRDQSVHAVHLQSTSSTALPGHFPPHPCCRRIERSRVFFPDMHFDQLLHFFHIQSYGQHCLLHACVMDEYPLQLPPQVAGADIFRFLVCVPPPQDLLQSEEADQAFQTQFFGQHL